MVSIRVRLKQSGFTLIELVIGFIAFAIVITLITGLIVPQATRSVDPIFQVRATELAQGLIDEINAKAFDEQADNTNGGLVRCGESETDVLLSLGVNPDTLPDDFNLGSIVVPSCTPPGSLGADNGELLREDFDDVDDFNPFVADGSDITNSLGEPLELDGVNLYEGFSVQVSVFYDSNFDGIDDGVAGNVKLISVNVTTPNNDTLSFSSYRANF